MKFVILSDGRDGSHLLVEIMNLHPEIHCEAELFNPRHKKKFKDPVKYIEGFIPKDKHFGFKLMNHQIPNKEFIDYLKNNFDYFILCERRDLLRKFISHKIARKTKDWRIFDENKKSKIKIKPSKEQILKYINEANEDYKKTREMFKGKIVYFEDMIKDYNKYNEVFEYLGLKKIDISPDKIKMKKQETRELKDILINYKELKDESILV
jgi:hypothetical protein